MGWDKGGRYYTRSRRENGRVVREYVGGGQIGELAEQLDAIERDKRESELAVARAERQSIDALLNDLNELTDLLVCATLVAAGFHQHNRGNWRKRRVDRTEAG